MSGPEKVLKDAHQLNGALWHEHWKINCLTWAADTLICSENKTDSNNEKLIETVWVMIEVIGEASARLGDINEGLHKRLWHDEQRRNAMQKEIDELRDELGRRQPVRARRREKAHAAS